MIGSVRGAAARLDTAPSALSQQIRALETDLGLELFSRSRRRLVPTPAGRALLEEAERVFEAIAGFEVRAEELRDLRSDRLVIGCFSSAGDRWIADLVAYLEHTHRDLSVRLEMTDGDLREEGMALQLVISRGSELDVPSTMDSRLLVVDPYVAALPRSSPLARESSVSLARLRQLPWIDNDDLAPSGGQCRQVFIDACRSAGVDLSFRHQAHSYRTALEMVDRGLGATVLPALGLTGIGPATAVLPISDPGMRRCVYAVWRTDGPHTAVLVEAVRALLSLVSEQETPYGETP